MAIYRFRVTFEDYDDVTRDIEIRSDQTFEDLHIAIQKSIDFDNKQLASFYMSNDSWKKGQEITLMDMSDDDNSSIPVMNKSLLCDFIEDPHQKIIYIFDFLALWTFMVELIKIVPQEKGAQYPRCIKTVGAAPKQHKSTKAPDIGEEDEEPKSNRKKEKIFDATEEYEAEDADDESEEAAEGEDEFGYDGEFDDNIKEEF
jgi:hypothetical protein